jgi:heme/copper-type cytochrome/quinol oxidase subunit 2
LLSQLPLVAVDWPALAQEGAIRIIARVFAVTVVVGLGLLIAFLWKRYRKEHWAETPAHIRIPAGRWIVIVLIVAAAAYITFLFLRDPLVRH